MTPLNVFMTTRSADQVAWENLSLRSWVSVDRPYALRRCRAVAVVQNQSPTPVQYGRCR
jgi:hypothetical protein